MRRRRQFGLLTTMAAAAVLCVSCSSGVVGDEASGSAGASVASPSATPSSTVPVDDRFLAALGGTVTDVRKDITLTMGQRACGAFAEGSAVKDIRAILVGKGLTETQANRVVLAAVSTYCPEFKSKAVG